MNFPFHFWHWKAESKRLIINLLFQIAESLPWEYIIYILGFDIWQIVVGTTDLMPYPKHENLNVTWKVKFLNCSSRFGGCQNIYHGFYDLTQLNSSNFCVF